MNMHLESCTSGHLFWVFTPSSMRNALEMSDLLNQFIHVKCYCLKSRLKLNNLVWLIYKIIQRYFAFEVMSMMLTQDQKTSLPKVPCSFFWRTKQKEKKMGLFWRWRLRQRGAFCHLCETSHSSIPRSEPKKRLVPEISSFSSAAEASGCEGTEKLTN